MKDENALLQIYMKSFKHICSSRINFSIVRFMKRVTSNLPLWMCFDYMKYFQKFQFQLVFGQPIEWSIAFAGYHRESNTTAVDVAHHKFLHISQFANAKKHNKCPKYLNRQNDQLQWIIRTLSQIFWRKRAINNFILFVKIWKYSTIFIFNSSIIAQIPAILHADTIVKMPFESFE